MPEMRRQTVRFGDSLWSLIEDESNRDGVSAAHWIREAALARALWERQRRGDPNGPAIVDTIHEEQRAENERHAQAVRDVLAHARPELEAMLPLLPPASASWIRDLYGL